VTPGDAQPPDAVVSVPLRRDLPFRAERDELWARRLLGAPVNAGARHEQAQHELGLLVVLVLSAPGSGPALHSLTNGPELAADSALVLGCLLWCARDPRGAETWWHIAAGADSATAAHLLSTHHLSLGEVDDGRYWGAWTLHLHRYLPPLPALPTAAGPALLSDADARDLLNRATYDLDLTLPIDLQILLAELPRTPQCQDDGEPIPGLPASW